MDSSPILFLKDSSDPKDNGSTMQLVAKKTLQNRLFVGNFQEKRYVASLQAYRDVVVVSNDESELLRDLKAVKHSIRDFYPYDHWVGITDPNTIGAPSGYCLWTELPDDVFGNYWFKIKRVKFRDNEVLPRLQIIRPVESSISGSNLKSLQVSNSFKKEQLVEVFADNFTWFFTTVVTLRNTKETLTFLSVLLVALVTALIHILQYLGDFTLKLMREISNFIHVLTPSIIAFINLCAKIIGGFYLLILSMWKTRSQPTYKSSYIATSDMRNEYNTVYFRRALPPPPRRTGGVVITPLD